MAFKVRSQADDFVPICFQTALVCPISDDKTRQEQLDSTDINRMLSRHGVQVPMRPYQAGDVDFDLDLQSAYAVSANARRYYDALSDDAKERYPSLGEFLDAAAQQELDLTPKPAEVPKVPQAGLPSDSAAGVRGSPA